MKVLEQPIWLQFTCEACGAVCEAEPEDVTYRPNVDHEGDVVGHICVVECGRCGKEHDVPGKLVTQKIRDIASDKRRRRSRS